MKNWIYILISLFVASMSITSCSPDDKPEDTIIKLDNKSFVGQWCSFNGNEITYLNLGDQQKLSERKVYEVGEFTTKLIDDNCNPGQWGIIEGTMRIQCYSSLTGNDINLDYNTANVTNYGFTASQTNIGFTQNYSRVVVNRTTTVGETFKFTIPDAYKDFTPTAYTSSDWRVASVDAEGNVKIKKCGAAFIFASSAAGTLVAKVETPAPKTDVIPQCYMTDVFLTVDEFYKQHDDYYFLGQPDYSDGTFSFVPNSSIFSYCTAYFDTNTGEIYTMFYNMKEPNDRPKLEDYLSQVLCAVVNKAGNTVFTNTGSVDEYDLGAYFYKTETSLFLRYINNRWYRQHPN